MQQINWFARKFDFSFKQNIFPSIIERLAGTIIRLDHKIQQIPRGELTKKMDETWSIQENIGHLIDLEPLWQGRLRDMLNGLEFMREADLQNTHTHQAKHNEADVDDLLASFATLRKQTLKSLGILNEKEIYQSSLHPRLKSPMRVMDLFLFVAEHDDHHLARISELHRSFS